LEAIKTNDLPYWADLEADERQQLLDLRTSRELEAGLVEACVLRAIEIARGGLGTRLYHKEVKKLYLDAFPRVSTWCSPKSAVERAIREWGDCTIRKELLPLYVIAVSLVLPQNIYVEPKDRVVAKAI
jgi:hypothetical protein